jgi:hypothetical protein
MQILERLARLEGAETVGFVEYAYQASLNLSWGMTLMAIVPDADRETCNVLNRLVRAGFNVILLVVEPYADFATAHERARHLGFAAYHLPDRQALRRWSRVADGGQ